MGDPAPEMTDKKPTVRTLLAARAGPGGPVVLVWGESRPCPPPSARSPEGSSEKPQEAEPDALSGGFGEAASARTKAELDHVFVEQGRSLAAGPRAAGVRLGTLAETFLWVLQMTSQEEGLEPFTVRLLKFGRGDSRLRAICRCPTRYDAQIVVVAILQRVLNVCVHRGAAELWPALDGLGPRAEEFDDETLGELRARRENESGILLVTGPGGLLVDACALAGCVGFAPAPGLLALPPEDDNGAAPG